MYSGPVRDQLFVETVIHLHQVAPLGAACSFVANTYTQIYVQVVFAVRGRQNLIAAQHREELHKYITGIVQERDHKMLAIFCMPDHLHFLAGIKPRMAISDLVRDVKSFSSAFIGERGWIKGKFSWQEGFGAFSYSRSQIDSVIRYVLNQEEHHREKTFQREYLALLKDFGVQYDDRYLFDWIEAND
jgi:putative transposase